MNAAAKNENPRISARMSKEDCNVISEAAYISGTSVNRFMAAAALREAQSVLKKESTVRISDKYAEVFMAAISDDATPNTRLLAAAERYKERSL